MSAGRRLPPVREPVSRAGGELMSRTAAVRTAMAHLAETSRSDLPSVGPLRFDRLGLPIRDRMGCFDERVRRWLSGP